MGQFLQLRSVLVSTRNCHENFLIDFFFNKDSFKISYYFQNAAEVHNAAKAMKC